MGDFGFFAQEMLCPGDGPATITDWQKRSHNAADHGITEGISSNCHDNVIVFVAVPFESLDFPDCGCFRFFFAEGKKVVHPNQTLACFIEFVDVKGDWPRKDLVTVKWCWTGSIFRDNKT